MSFLSRFQVDLDIAIDLGIRDNYQWHKKIWEFFPNNKCIKRDYLSRIDTHDRSFLVWILSQIKPECPVWLDPDRLNIKPISDSFFSHSKYAFDIVVNPTKSLTSIEKSKRGKRVSIVKEDELREWIQRKGVNRSFDKNGNPIRGGFKIIQEKPLEIGRMYEYYFNKGEHVGFHGGVRFKGFLEVTDAAAFRQTYFQGIGSAKGFGFGLMLLAPIK